MFRLSMLLPIIISDGSAEPSSDSVTMKHAVPCIEPLHDIASRSSYRPAEAEALSREVEVGRGLMMPRTEEILDAHRQATSRLANQRQRLNDWC